MHMLACKKMLPIVICQILTINMIYFQILQCLGSMGFLWKKSTNEMAQNATNQFFTQEVLHILWIVFGFY
jgi:hypothetical protein